MIDVQPRYLSAHLQPKAGTTLQLTHLHEVDAWRPFVRRLRRRWCRPFLAPLKTFGLEVGEHLMLTTWQRARSNGRTDQPLDGTIGMSLSQTISTRNVYCGLGTILMGDYGATMGAECRCPTCWSSMFQKR